MPGFKSRKVIFLTVAAVALIALLFSFMTIDRSEGENRPQLAQPAGDPAFIQRGRYLANAGNCVSCHTVPGRAEFAGGVRFNTPFGTVFSTNITPDRETGIGRWSAEDFRRAMHEGIAADGSPLFPAFPYTSYTKVSDEDTAAIYAFLRTLKPVRYTPPNNSFAFWMRWPMRLWNAAFFEPGRYVNDSSRDAQWNRGAYLVQGLGHCTACHSPRNSAMAEIKERSFEGGVMHDHVENAKDRAWFAVNLTQSKNGLASWSVDDMTKYLHKGFSPRAGTFGPMNDVIVNSLTKLSEEDARAMAIYLKSLPGRPYTGQTIPEHQANEGAALYEEHCEDCHGKSGRGGLFSA
ncbi:MAG TPA: c-type cytochrome, partial [Steroidobacteraceae bacterium]|nr:c-type cytochrome [Steroidobacteraceae bacterium]